MDMGEPDPLREPQAHCSGWHLRPAPTWTDPGYTSTGSEPSLLWSPQRLDWSPEWFPRMPCVRPWWSLSLTSSQPTEYPRPWTPAPRPGEYRTLSGAPVGELPESQRPMYFPGALRHPWSGEPPSQASGLWSWPLESGPPTAMFLSPYSSHSPAIAAQMEYSSRFALVPPPPPPFSSYQVNMKMALPRAATYNPPHREQVRHAEASQRACLRLLPCPQTPALLTPQPDVSGPFTPTVINQPPFASPALSPWTSWSRTDEGTRSVPSSHDRSCRGGSNHWLAEEPDSDLSLIGPIFATSYNLSLQPDFGQTSANDQIARTSTGDDRGLLEGAGLDPPRRRNQGSYPWHSPLDLGQIEILDPVVVHQIPDHGSETLDGDVGGDWFREDEDEEEEPEEETWTHRFTEYLDELVKDEDFVSTVGSILDMAFLETPEPTELIGPEHGETFQADIQQTQDGGSFGDDGAISEFDSTGSLAVVVLNSHHTNTPPQTAGWTPSWAPESPSVAPAPSHDGSDQPGPEDVWESWLKSMAQPLTALLCDPPIPMNDGEVEAPHPKDSPDDQGTGLEPFCSEVFSLATVEIESPSPGTEGAFEFRWEHFDASITGELSLDVSKCDDEVLPTMATLANKYPFPSPPNLSILRSLSPLVSPSSPSARVPSPLSGGHVGDPLISISAEPKRREDPENETQEEDEGGALDGGELRSAPSEEGLLGVTHDKLPSWRDGEPWDLAQSTASSKDRYSDGARGMAALHVDVGTYALLENMSVNATKAFLELDFQVDVTGLPPLDIADNAEYASADRELAQPEDKAVLVVRREEVHEAASSCPGYLESGPASTDSTGPAEGCRATMYTQQAPAVSTLTSEHGIVHPENQQAPGASPPSLGERATPLNLNMIPGGFPSGPLTGASSEGREEVGAEKETFAGDTYASPKACEAHEVAAWEDSPILSPSRSVREGNESRKKEDQIKISSPIKRGKSLRKISRRLWPLNEGGTLETVTRPSDLKIHQNCQTSNTCSTNRRCSPRWTLQFKTIRSSSSSGKNGTASLLLEDYKQRLENARAPGEESSHKTPDKSLRGRPRKVLFSGPELCPMAIPCVNPGSIHLTRMKRHKLPTEKEKERAIYNFTLRDLRAKTLVTEKSGLTTKQRMENSDKRKTEEREMAMTSKKAPRASPRLRNRSKTQSPLRQPRRRTTALGKVGSGPREITALSDTPGRHTPRPTRRLKRDPANQDAPVTPQPSPAGGLRNGPTDDKRKEDENEERMSSPRKRSRGLAVKGNGDIVPFQQSPVRERRKCRMYDEDEKEKTPSPTKRSRRGRVDGEEDGGGSRKPNPDREKRSKQRNVP
ncbi:uncharacterized protein LOC115529948 [Gadus morhua]|uniref:uncharacterized protein LOC115529948 n=1 Tax=Gadus morhua TaxID=8049 RepID=UPI0011B81A6F|nr:uncharacterized protein LOC115529948 [Gadus morhua]